VRIAAAACAAKGFRAINIPADGTPITETVTPNSCFDFKIDSATEDCFCCSAGETISNPGVFYYIAAAPVVRNITVTTCITMSHDPASIEYDVDPGIVVFESDSSCAIASNALFCGKWSIWLVEC
jgi:hypothetical protein